MHTATHKTTPLDYQRARALRKQSCSYEHRLWNELRHIRKTTGIKFRRQHPMSPYIVDFVCLKAKLIIELDGFSHDNMESQKYDERRDIYLQNQGFRILRFKNDDVQENIGGVIDTILLNVRQLMGNTFVQANPPPAKSKDLLKQVQDFASSPARGEG